MFSIGQFIFPTFCIYCRKEETIGTLLCPSCIEIPLLLEIQGRCKRCFRIQEEPRCEYCKKDPPFFRKSGYCFSKRSSLSPLQRDTFRFAKTIGAFFLLQWDRLGFPIPHMVVAERGLEEAKREFQKFLPLNKTEQIPLEVLYLSLKGDPPERYDPFIGKRGYQIALYGEDDESGY